MVHPLSATMLSMEVGIRQLRMQLSQWVSRAREGEEIIVTEHGRPVARLSALPGAAILDRLVEQGIVTGPSSAERETDPPTVRPRRSVADLLLEERHRRAW